MSGSVNTIHSRGVQDFGRVILSAKLFSKPDIAREAKQIISKLQGFVEHLLFFLTAGQYDRGARAYQGIKQQISQLSALDISGNTLRATFGHKESGELLSLVFDPAKRCITLYRFPDQATVNCADAGREDEICHWDHVDFAQDFFNLQTLKTEFSRIYSNVTGHNLEDNPPGELLPYSSYLSVLSRLSTTAWAESRDATAEAWDSLEGLRNAVGEAQALQILRDNGLQAFIPLGWPTEQFVSATPAGGQSPRKTLSVYEIRQKLARESAQPTENKGGMQQPYVKPAGGNQSQTSRPGKAAEPVSEPRRQVRNVQQVAQPQQKEAAKYKWPDEQYRRVIPDSVRKVRDGEGMSRYHRDCFSPEVNRQLDMLFSDDGELCQLFMGKKISIPSANLDFALEAGKLLTGLQKGVGINGNIPEKEMRPPWTGGLSIESAIKALLCGIPVHRIFRYYISPETSVFSSYLSAYLRANNNEYRIKYNDAAASFYLEQMFATRCHNSPEQVEHIYDADGVKSGTVYHGSQGDYRYNHIVGELINIHNNSWFSFGIICKDQLRNMVDIRLNKAPGDTHYTARECEAIVTAKNTLLHFWSLDEVNNILTHIENEISRNSRLGNPGV